MLDKGPHPSLSLYPIAYAALHSSLQFNSQISKRMFLFALSRARSLRHHHLHRVSFIRFQSNWNFFKLMAVGEDSCGRCCTVTVRQLLKSQRNFFFSSITIFILIWSMAMAHKKSDAQKKLARPKLAVIRIHLYSNHPHHTQIAARAYAISAKLSVRNKSSKNQCYPCSHIAYRNVRILIQSQLHRRRCHY